MSVPTLKKGSTLHISNTGPSSDPSRAHLFIIVTDECVLQKRLLVSVCTQKSGYDATCPLFIGQHQFITKDSYVAYNHARIFDVAHLQEKLISGEISYRGEFLPSLFPKVCEGVLLSPFTSLKIKNYYKSVTTS